MTKTIRTVATVGRVAAAFVGLLAAPATIRAAAVLGGGSLLSFGAGMVYQPAGYIVGGFLLLVAGVLGHMRGAGE